MTSKIMTSKIWMSLIMVSIGVVLGLSTAVTVSAQRGTLMGVIRVPKSFGVVPAGPGHSQAAVNPCGQFYVAVLDPDNGNRHIATVDSTIVQGRDQGDFYTCKFSFTVPVNKRLFAVAGMGGSLLLPKEDRASMYITDAWIGGTNNKPRRGYERGFSGKFVTLGNKAVYLRFDLHYAQVDPE